MRIRLLAAVAAALVVAAPAAAASSPAKPSVVVLKSLLTQQYTDHDYATRTYSIKWGTFQYAAPRVGNHWADGTPANKKTTVFPVRAQFVRSTHYSTDNTTRVELIRADYVFFRDEFGTWTFRIQHEEI